MTATVLLWIAHFLQQQCRLLIPALNARAQCMTIRPISTHLNNASHCKLHMTAVYRNSKHNKKASYRLYNLHQIIELYRFDWWSDLIDDQVPRFHKTSYCDSQTFGDCLKILKNNTKVAVSTFTLCHTYVKLLCRVGFDLVTSNSLPQTPEKLCHRSQYASHIYVKISKLF